MEAKKTPKADLENKKILFSEIGLAVALGITLAAFEATSQDVTIQNLEVQQEEVRLCSPKRLSFLRLAIVQKFT